MIESSQALVSAYEAIFQNDLRRAHEELHPHDSCSESLLLRATLFLKEGDLQNAFSFTVQAVYANPTNKRAWALLRDLLSHLSPPLSEVTHALVHDLLSLDGIDHQKLAPYISKILAPLRSLPFDQLSNYPLFIDVLSKMLLTGWEWERAKASLRETLFKEYMLNPTLLEQRSLPLLFGLCNQFYLSDYLPESENEDRVAFLSPRTLRELLLKACFVPLQRVDFQNIDQETTNASPYCTKLFVRLGSDSENKPLALAAFTDDEKLHQFYEMNPYPRWEYLDLAQSPFPKHIELSLELGKAIAPLQSCLVAGMGTGAHILELAARYPSTYFTGIDLSKRSIEFAECKAALLKEENPALFENVECIQADLYQFKKEAGLDWQDDKFDWIECVGVIHHLESPESGWRALHRLAKDRALLCGGVYHRHARDLIKRFKNKDLKLSELRERIAQDPEGLPLVQSLDFYSLHACNDLLFHPREMSYTLTMLFEELKRTGWRFLKIEFGMTWGALYRQKYPSDFRYEHAESLLEFEKEHPSAFNGMILFWAEKI